jgi:hypothetical protein
MRLHSGDMAHIRDTAPVICRGFVIFEARHAKGPKGERHYADVCPHSPCYVWHNAREARDDFHHRIFRIRLNDGAHATLDRLSVIVDDLDAAKVKARSLFETLEMPQKPDGLRILDESGCELFFWNRGEDDA